MHFQRKMVWVTICIAVFWFIAFYLLKFEASKSERSMALFSGLMLYYGLLVISVPGFFTIKDRNQLFEPKFLWGTILLILWNVLAPLLASLTT